MQILFGSGLVAFTPPGSNPTPIVCGVLQDVSVKVSASQKQLFGQNQFPVAVADTERKLDCSAKFAQIYGSFIKNALNGSITSGQTIGAINEQATIAGTVTVVNSATFVADFSVYDYTAGKPMTRVASAPASGQYSVSAGVYTFNAADAGHVAGFNYSYTTTSGQTVSVTNTLMGAANTFTAALFNSFNGQNFGMKLYAITLAGLDFAFKNNDFALQNLGFQGYADTQNRVIDIYTGE